MVPGFFSIKSFILHFAGARSYDRFHSPYLFHFFQYCCNDIIHFSIFEEIEKHRQLFIHSKENFTRTDHGAGSFKTSRQEQAQVSAIARHSLSKPFQCRLMSRIVKQTKPDTILELGTSLGISGAYLVSGNLSSKMITVDADPFLAEKATSLYRQLGLTNISVINREFKSFLEKPNSLPLSLDLIFLDGHHHGSALIMYYHLLKKHFHSQTVIVVDDIHWSADMYTGWLTLCQQPEVTQSVDCFHFGILWCKKDFLAKEHHCIRLPLKGWLG